MKPYDAVVVGLGVMGAAVAFHLARRGLRVLGLDRGWPAHDRGASSGESRMLRRAYPEHDDYVPLAARAHELWRQLEARVGRRLLLPTGGLVVGRPGAGAGWLEGVVASAAAHAIPHTRLDTSALRARLPMLHFADGEEGYLERDAAVLFAEECVRALHQAAIAAGAELRFGAAVDLPSLRDDCRDAVRTLTVGDARIPTHLTVLTLGSWAVRLAGPDWPALEIERVVSYWLDPGAAPGPFHPGRFPFVVWDRAEAPMCLFPALERGIKTGFQRSGQLVDPDDVARAAPDGELAQLRARLTEIAPELARAPLRSWHAGVYTNTANRHFVIRRSQDRLLVSACSGHGFKFAPVIGEALAALVTEGRTHHQLRLFGAVGF